MRFLTAGRRRHPTSSSPQRRSRARLLALGLAGVGAAAQAQVIEIGDDGSATTYSGPTRFVAEAPATPVAVRPTAAPVDMYERAAQRHGLDASLLRAIAWTESRGNAGAISPKGALGTMQLMPTTAAELGVDPRNPEQNVSGGAAYFARQLKRFRSVPLALAAYNAGPEAVARWGGIPPYAETRSYVSSILQRWQARAVAQ